MKKLLHFIITVLLLLSASAMALNLDSIIVTMRTKKTVVFFGSDNENGKFVVYLYDYTILPNEQAQLSLEKAKIEAKNSLSGYLKTQNKGLVKSSNTATVTAANGASTATYDSTFSKFIQQSTENNFFGMTQKTTIKREQIEVVSFLCERVTNASKELEAAIGRQEQPNTVIACGSSIIDGQMDLAEKMALQEAHRQAISMVLGEQIVSNTKRMTTAKTVAADGDSASIFKDSFRAKMYSSAQGFVESSRILDKKVIGNVLTVKAVVKVSEKKLLDDYRACLAAFGNPGFLVRSNDESCIDMANGFLSNLGIRTVIRKNEGDYWVNIRTQFQVVEKVERGYRLAGNLSIELVDPSTKNVIFALVTQNGSTIFGEGMELQGHQALAKVLFDSVKVDMHNMINRYLGRINADGRQVQVLLSGYDKRYYNVAKEIQKCLDGIPGVQEVEMEIREDEVLYSFQYAGDTKELKKHLEEQMNVHIAKKRLIPTAYKLSTNKICFEFEY